MVLTNAVLLAGLPSIVEKKRDPVHFKRLVKTCQSKHSYSVTHASD
jgi:hypothetical protein